jgi:hypothetical protein
MLSIYQEVNAIFIGFKGKGNKMTSVYLSFTGLAQTYTERLLSATKQNGFSHLFPSIRTRITVPIKSNGMIYYVIIDRAGNYRKIDPELFKPMVF